MPESPKDFFRRHIHRRRFNSGALEASPKKVFKYLANRQRMMMIRGREEQEVLRLCVTAAQEPNLDDRLRAYRQTQRYDLGHMAPAIRDTVWRVLQDITAAHELRQAGEAPLPVVDP